MNADDQILRELRRIRKANQRATGELVLCTIYLGAIAFLLWAILDQLKAEEVEDE